MKELWRFQTTEAVGQEWRKWGVGDREGRGGGGSVCRLGVMWKSHSLKWRVQKQQEKSKGP